MSITTYQAVWEHLNRGTHEVLWSKRDEILPLGSFSYLG